MEQPLVSVVMPAFNAGKYIQAAIQSIFDQTYDNWELIIIDDASNDNTFSIACTFQNDLKVTILQNETNRGIVYSRNKGIALAKGKYIAILDSDDIALPMRLELQVNYMQDHPALGAIGSFYYVINNEGKKQASIKVPSDPMDIATFLLFNVSFCHSTLMMKASIAKQYQYRKGFDIIEDYEIAYRISRDFPLGNLTEYTVQYRVHGLNISIEKKERLLMLRKQIDQLVLEDLGIPFSYEELELHSNFINMNEKYFQSAEKLNLLEDWLLKFHAFCLADERINSKMLRRILTVRWSTICFRNRFYYRLIQNQLWREFRGDFMKYNIRHVQNMVKGTFEVV